MAIATPTTSSPSADRSAIDFGAPADETSVERAAAALGAKGYAVHVVDDGAAARQLVARLLPDGAEVSQGASKTLEETGITDDLEAPGRYANVRLRTRAMDRTTPEGIREMRKLGVGPDWFVNSVHAVTEDGVLVNASNTGSQLAPLAFGAGEVIFVVGSQKIVPDLETALNRIERHVLPLESQRMQGLYGVDSEIKKILIINKEFRPDRFTVILVREPLGF